MDLSTLLKTVHKYTWSSNPCPTGSNFNQGDLSDGIHSIGVAAFNTIAQLRQSQICHTIAQLRQITDLSLSFIIDGDDGRCSRFFTSGAYARHTAKVNSFTSYWLAN